MEILQGVIGVLILIIIGMFFARIMQVIGLIVEVIIKSFRKLFRKLGEIKRKKIK